MIESTRHEDGGAISRSDSPARRALAVATLIAATAIGCGGASRSAPAASQPNVLLIVSDDEPMGMTKRMPFLSGAGFERFSSYYDNNPLCCPTRSTLLTGLYSNHTGIETNLHAGRFDPSSTLATWLQTAGYETGLFGKYLNDYPWNRGADYIPPGWDRWSAFTPDAAYYDYTLVQNRGREQHGSAPADYSTDVLADAVDRFIGTAQQPFFAYFAPYAPHAPRTPAARDRSAFANTPVRLSRNFNRVASGAPRWWAKLPKLSPATEKRATKDQWRSLLAVDDALRRFVQTLRTTGKLEDTVIIYLSDNGYSLGSHRNPQKDCAYEECIHLPLLVSWPGHTQPDARVGALVSSPDIAPTIAAIAGATPTAPVDGTSLVPLIDGTERSLDRPVLLRHVHYPRVAPTFWGLRTERYTYVEYRDGERELYDDRADPAQLRNLDGRKSVGRLERRLHSELRRLRTR